MSAVMLYRSDQINGSAFGFAVVDKVAWSYQIHVDARKSHELGLF